MYEIDSNINEKLETTKKCCYFIAGWITGFWSGIK